jgi:hypothetical protein
MEHFDIEEKFRFNKRRKIVWIISKNKIFLCRFGSHMATAISD